MLSPSTPRSQTRVGAFWRACQEEGRLARTLDDVFATPFESRPVRVQTVNLQHVHQIVTSDVALEAVLGAHLITADGWPLAVLAGQRGERCERVTGRQVVDALLQDRQQAGRKVALLGSRPDVAATFGRMLARNGVTLAYSRHGDASTWDTAGIAAELTRQDCDVVLIALGAPKGEVLGNALAGLLTRGLIVGIGGAAEMATNHMPAAPEWVGRAGLEWAYRLVHEPRRLGRRYLVESPRALLALLLVLARVGR
jgi:N-acetylglucosaminyldiphosphoundecaprenol N-acetyl-beta-D-mannosaminyltransferase